MHFLKCNNCGHFNEVKNEYLIFCSKCNKKLNNNFSDWSKRNSDKSFEDYKKFICTTESIDIPKDLGKHKTKKGIKYWIGFAAAFAIFYAIGTIGGEKLASLFRKPAFEKAMIEFANEINKNCPIMIDGVTRLDNVISLPKKVFQYNYTILMAKDSIKINELKDYLEPRIVNTVKTEPQMKIIRDNKITINYSYKDILGEHLFIIIVKPEQYE
jgi:hypothetical protein